MFRTLPKHSLIHFLEIPDGVPTNPLGTEPTILFLVLEKSLKKIIWEMKMYAAKVFKQNHFYVTWKHLHSNPNMRKYENDHF